MSRFLYIDVLRAMAIIFVVFTHVGIPVFEANDKYPPLTWGAFNVMSAAIRLSVPIFIMISGKLLLGSSRTEPPLHLVKRRLLPILAPFFVWSMIYALFDARDHHRPFSFSAAVLKFLQGPTEYHLWFMYTIIGIFLVAPFLKTFAKNASRRDLHYILGLWFLFLVAQFNLPAYDNWGPAGMLLSYGGYFILGHALDEIPVPPRAGRVLFALAALIIAAHAVMGFQYIKAGGLPQERTYGYLAPGIVLYAAVVFLAVKSVGWEIIFRRWPAVGAVVTWLSAETFNLYLIHVLFIALFMDGHFGFSLDERTGGTPLIGIPLTTLVVLLATSATSALLQRVPKASRLLVIPTERKPVPVSAVAGADA